MNECTRIAANTHNFEYEKEKLRLQLLTPQKRNLELISRGVSKALVELKPQVQSLIG